MTTEQSPEDKQSEFENDIMLSNETDSIITYSSYTPIEITRQCRNQCPYCSFKRTGGLAVPYSTIHQAKKARKLGIREALIVSGERPDKFPEVRANLDLWGFSSFIDYLYTVAELNFLEGLIPVIEVGFLSPSELKKISEITAILKCMLDTVEPRRYSSVYPNSPGKRTEIRYKNIEWAGKLKMPVSTGILVGIGESKSHRESSIKQIAKLHQNYGHIHEFRVQNFYPQPGTLMASKSPPSHKVMMETVEAAIALLPKDILVTIPVHLNEKVSDFIHAGIRDFGQIPIQKPIMVTPKKAFNLAALEAEVNACGFRLSQRFPLQHNFIKGGRYSKKLGQVFDSYKYKIAKKAKGQAI